MKCLLFWVLLVGLLLEGHDGKYYWPTKDLEDIWLFLCRGYEPTSMRSRTVHDLSISNLSGEFPLQSQTHSAATGICSKISCGMFVNTVCMRNRKILRVVCDAKTQRRGSYHGGATSPSLPVTRTLLPPNLGRPLMREIILQSRSWSYPFRLSLSHFRLRSCTCTTLY